MDNTAHRDTHTSAIQAAAQEALEMGPRTLISRCLDTLGPVTAAEAVIQDYATRLAEVLPQLPQLSIDHPSFREVLEARPDPVRRRILSEVVRKGRYPTTRTGRHLAGRDLRWIAILSFSILRLADVEPPRETAPDPRHLEAMWPMLRILIARVEKEQRQVEADRDRKRLSSLGVSEVDSSPAHAPLTASGLTTRSPGRAHASSPATSADKWPPSLADLQAVVERVIALDPGLSLRADNLGAYRQRGPQLTAWMDAIAQSGSGQDALAAAVQRGQRDSISVPGQQPKGFSGRVAQSSRATAIALSRDAGEASDSEQQDCGGASQQFLEIYNQLRARPAPEWKLRLRQLHTLEMLANLFMHDTEAASITDDRVIDLMNKIVGAVPASS